MSDTEGDAAPRPAARRPALTPYPEDIDTIKLIGLGGTGGLVARHLILYLAAQGTPVRVTLIDGDEFEPHNAARMAFSHYGNKAVVIRDDLMPLIGDAPITLTAAPHFVTPENVASLIHDGDVVLLAVDNHASRKLVSEHCAGTLTDVCLISGGNDGVGRDGAGRLTSGTYGNVQIHLRRGGRDETPHLAAYHPEIANPADKLPTDVSCTEALESVPQLLFANLFAAATMLNAFYLHVCRETDYAEVCFDIRDGLMRPLELPSPE